MLNTEYKSVEYKGKLIYDIEYGKKYNITIEKGRYTYELTIEYEITDKENKYVDKVINYSSETSIRQDWELE